MAYLDATREFVGLALKSLGLSYNTRAPAATASSLPLLGQDCGSGRGVTEEQLRERVDALRSQALLFSSRDHIRALSSGGGGRRSRVCTGEVFV